MAILLVIPARFQSQRFEGKPLAGLRGAGGVAKPLIQRSWEAAQRVRKALPDLEIVIATDDKRIAECAEGFGARAVMTSSDARNGTERCAEAALTCARDSKTDYELIINLQGDAPLTPPDFITALISAMRKNPTADMATPVLLCDAQTLANLKQDRKAGRVGGTTAVFDENGRALYFSKEVIPYADGTPDNNIARVYHHVGVYAYRPAALKTYTENAPCIIEMQEGLEQLRFLSFGAHVQCVTVQGKGRAFWEVNNPPDIARVEGMLADLGIE